MRRAPRILTLALVLSSLVVSWDSPRAIAQQATPASPLVDASTGDFQGSVDIGGRSLFLTCAGEGSPTVIFEAGGGGTPSSDWQWVMRDVAPLTRTCRYERANNQTHLSDPAPTPRTAADVVADLHALLTAAHVPGPYVLVGSSLGGLFVRLYASTYPDEVVGMVLSETVHEDLYKQAKPLFSPEVIQEMRELDALGDGEGDPEGIYTVDGIDESFAQVRTARHEHPIPPMPLIVLAAGQIEDLAAEGFPAEYAALWKSELARALQEDLATLTPDARLIVAERSGHFIHRQEAALVVQAITEVVEAVRDPSTWETAATPVLATPAP